MKISFDEKEYSFIEVYRDAATAKVIISISVRSPDNPLKTIVNSVDLTEAEFLQLVSELDLV